MRPNDALSAMEGRLHGEIPVQARSGSSRAAFHVAKLPEPMRAEPTSRVLPREA